MKKIERRNALPENQLPMIDEDDAAPVPQATAAQIAKIRELAALQFKQEKAVEKAEAALKTAKGKLAITNMVDIPKVMKAAGMDTCPLNNGYKIDLDKVIQASIPSLKSKKENAEELNARGIAYMKKHGPDLVDTVLIERYPRGTEKELARRLKENARRKNPIEFEVSETVNTGSLQAWIRKRDEAGIATDSDALNIHRFEISKIVKPKDKKKAAKVV